MISMPIGRYRGMRMRDVPRPYLMWLRRQPTIGAELKAALSAELGMKAKSAEVHRHAPVDVKLRAAGDSQ